MFSTLVVNKDVYISDNFDLIETFRFESKLLYETQRQRDRQTDGCNA